MKLLRFLLVLLLIAGASVALAQSNVQVPSIQIGLGEGKNQGEISTSLQILALLTILSIAPAILILTTAFTRIVIVLSLLRTAMGTQAIPPNQVLVGLSMFLTFYVMAPTYQQINDKALQPYIKKEITLDVAAKRAEQPIRQFMLKNTYKSDLQLFLDYRGEVNATKDNVSLISLIPAFIISELKTAFIVGFYIFLPFVVIDLIVASVLMSMGMMMMPPVVVSLPAKLLIFVLADGWTVITKALLAGYF